jgi:hypothetical protein
MATDASIHSDIGMSDPPPAGDLRPKAPQRRPM